MGMGLRVSRLNIFKLVMIGYYAFERKNSRLSFVFLTGQNSLFIRCEARGPLYFLANFYGRYS